MATDRQAYAQAMRELRRADRELASDLRQAQWGTKRAVARVAAQMRRVDRQAGRRLRTAWRRPPGGRIKLGLSRMPWPKLRVRAPLGGAKGAKGGQAPDTFHFNLKQTSSGSVGASHQRYIERDDACVESFGTLADTFEERCRLWDAIGQRTDKKEGCLIVEADAPDELKRAVAARILAWGEEGWVSVRQAKATYRLHEKRWDSGKPLRIKTFDKADHQELAKWFRDWGERRAAQEEAERRRGRAAGARGEGGGGRGGGGADEGRPSCDSRLQGGHYLPRAVNAACGHHGPPRAAVSGTGSGFPRAAFSTVSLPFATTSHAGKQLAALVRGTAYQQRTALRCRKRKAQPTRQPATRPTLYLNHLDGARPKQGPSPAPKLRRDIRLQRLFVAEPAVMAGHVIVGHALPDPGRCEQRIALRFEDDRCEGQPAGLARPKDVHALQCLRRSAMVLLDLTPAYAVALKPVRGDVEEAPARHVGDYGDMPMGASARRAAVFLVPLT